MEFVRDYFRRVTATLVADAARAGTISHAATTGRLRELILRDYLRPLLPRHFEIRSGKIIDASGSMSDEQDCMVIDSRMPLIDVSSDETAMVLAESVVATIQVKSSLNKQELLSALEASVKTKSLQRGGAVSYQKGPAEILVPNGLPILTYLFAYDGLDPDTIGGHVHDFAHGQIDDTKHYAHTLLDAICVLSRGVVFNQPRHATVSGSVVTLPELGDATLTWVRAYKDALLLFSQRLCSDITYFRLRSFDLDHYFHCDKLE